MNRRIAGAGLLALLAAFVPLELEAQNTGRIVGNVRNAQTAEPLTNAQVYLDGTDIGTLSTSDGRYVLRGVPAGTHDLIVQILGFATKTITGVQVGAGETATLDVAMEPEAISLQGIEVTAAAERSSQAFLLDQRRTSSSLVDAVGAETIERTPDGDAAEVAQRMTGVTVSDGKYVFVRGLGQRYSQTSFNGTPLPSPEPESEVVPLDLFPADFLESLSTQKSYTPDRWADFSGGTVEIETKDFPDQLTWKLGIGSSYNTQSQGESGFLVYDGGGRDWLGFDDGTRELPSTVRNALGGLEGERLPQDNNELAIQISRELPTQFTPATDDTPLNRSFDLSVGNTTQIFGRDVGFLISGNYSDSYTIRADEVERKWRTTAFEVDEPTANVDYNFDRSTRSISWGSLTNLAVQLTPTQKIGFRGTFNVNTDDESRTYTGLNQEDLGGWVRADRLRFISRWLGWGQLNGEHGLWGGPTLEWKLTAARAFRDEPALREAIYLGDGPDEPLFLESGGESGRYLWSELTDNDLNAETKITFPFELGSFPASFEVGGAYRSRTRDFASRRFNLTFLGSTIDNIDAALSDEVFVGRNPGVGEFGLDETVEPGNVYDVEDVRTAGYAMLDLQPHERLRTIFGARVETYSLDLVSGGNPTTDSEQTDVAPAVNVVFDMTDRSKLRFAASQTIDRPEFREIAPFQFTEATSLRQLYGNPDLTSPTIRSVDLRWDFFPRAAEILSIGTFYKQIDDPIEQVFLLAASTAYSYQNAEEAWILGFEFDSRFRLDYLAEALSDLSFEGNFSWIESEVDVRETASFRPTNLQRPLEGQAQYVLNTGLVYAPAFGSWEAGLFMNRLGERIVAAGGGGIPDIIEQPRTAMDASFKYRIRDSGLSFSLKGSNLLNSEYRFEQEANGVTRLQRSYETGATLSLGISMTR